MCLILFGFLVRFVVKVVLFNVLVEVLLIVVILMLLFFSSCFRMFQVKVLCVLFFCSVRLICFVVMKVFVFCFDYYIVVM